MDERAEVYPGDDFFGAWRIYSPEGDAWLDHAETLAEAKRWINEYDGYGK
jgi:antibiotic biosynthesis monooxygenase (ABM) superfamily enzyme